MIRPVLVRYLVDRRGELVLAGPNRADSLPFELGRVAADDPFGFAQGGGQLLVCCRQTSGPAIGLKRQISKKLEGPIRQKAESAAESFSRGKPADRFFYLQPAFSARRCGRVAIEKTVCGITVWPQDAALPGLMPKSRHNCLLNKAAGAADASACFQSPLIKN